MAIFSFQRLISGKWVVGFPKGVSRKPDWVIIRSLFKIGLPTGLQGVAKIHVGSRSALWIATHRATDWARFTLWSWGG